MLDILSPGVRSLVVDRGRPGLRHLGVPRGGAADRLSYQIANWLVGNAAEAHGGRGMGAVECALGGLKVRFARTTCFALGGAETDAALDGRAVPLWRARRAEAGQTLALGRARGGARTYLAVGGGVEGARHFGSLSIYPAAGLGANGGHALGAGDKLDTGAERPGNTGGARGGMGSAARTLPAGFRPHLSDHAVLRVRSVGEYERLSADSQRRLFVRPWQASVATSRMGTRLEGGRLVLEDVRGIVSSPLPTGTVQVPPDGKPILSLVDGHCTGGYARALRVIAADMWRAGQIGPGTRVSFVRAFARDVPALTDAHLALWGAVVEGFEL